MAYITVEGSERRLDLPLESDGSVAISTIQVHLCVGTSIVAACRNVFAFRPTFRLLPAWNLQKTVERDVFEVTVSMSLHLKADGAKERTELQRCLTNTLGGPAQRLRPLLGGPAQRLRPL